MNFTETPLLTQLPNGAIRLTGSRVTLEVIAGRIKEGMTAEEINDCFPAVSVEHIAGVMAWYQDNQAATEEYIRALDAEWEKLRQQIESLPGYKEFSEKIRREKNNGWLRNGWRLKANIKVTKIHFLTKCFVSSLTKTSISRILRGLKRRLPSLNIVLTEQASLRQTKDPDMLAWAARNNRTFLTHDLNTMVPDAIRLVLQGQRMAGCDSGSRAIGNRPSH